MVGYRELQLRPEPISLRSAPANVARFWALGRANSPRHFLAQPYAGEIRDDQVALARAGIPSQLVIGFAYAPYFNTTGDTVEQCSAESLAAVGGTLLQYLDSIP